MKLNGFSFQIRQYIRLLTLGLVTIAVIIVLMSAPSMAASSKASEITVYRAPSCSCCGGWIAHLAAQGFQLKEIATSNMNMLKQQHGVPNDLASCHTAVIQGYVIEGHVPVKDIKRLLAQHPKVAGIAVPGMPIGTPGMEDGDRREPFTVFSFDEQGNAQAFNQYAF
jgi:hypothetical protein